MTAENEDPNEYTNIPSIGDKAASFIAQSTKGEINFPDDFQDQWVVLFSHPVDFTPNGTSELSAYDKLQNDFEKLNCQLLGLSAEGFSSNNTMLCEIREKMKSDLPENIGIPFPLIEDPLLYVASKYGVIKPNHNNSSVRTVFLIDTDVMIRAIIYYTHAHRRNLDEVKNVLISLKRADRYKLLTHSVWKSF